MDHQPDTRQNDSVRTRSVRQRSLAMADAVTSWVPWTLSIWASPAFFLFALLHRQHARYLIDNRLPLPLRLELLMCVLGVIFCMAGAYFAGWRLLRHLRQREAMSLGEALTRINRYTEILLVLPFISLLGLEKIESHHPFLTLVVIALVGLLSARFVYRIMGVRSWWCRWFRWPTRFSGWPVGLAAVLVFAALYALRLSTFHIAYHENLGSRIYDLGIYANIFWQSIHGDLLGCSFLKGGSHLSAHFDPILVLFSPLYLLAPRAETLLVLQSVWLSLAAIPLYLIAVHHTKKVWFGMALSAVYLLYPCLHGANMYDFHSLTLVAPLLLWAVYLLEAGRHRWFFVVLALILLTREDMPLLACFLGLYAIVGRRTLGVGVATIAIALCYFLVVKLFIMHPETLMASGVSVHNFDYYYRDMISDGSGGITGLLLSLVSNPIFVLKHVLIEKKIFFLLLLLLPVAGMPLLSRRMWILFVYGLLFTLLATREYVYNPGFQYSVVLFPLLLAATPRGLKNLAEGRFAGVFGLDSSRLFAAAGIGMLVCALLTSASYGVFWQNDAFRGGFGRFHREEDASRQQRYRFLMEVHQLIPQDASVSASMRLGAYFASRRHAFSFPQVNDADYVLLWDGDLRKEMKARLQALERSGYRVLRKGHGIWVFKRSLP